MKVVARKSPVGWFAWVHNEYAEFGDASTPRDDYENAGDALDALAKKLCIPMTIYNIQVSNSATLATGHMLCTDKLVEDAMIILRPCEAGWVARAKQNPNKVYAIGSTRSNALAQLVSSAAWQDLMGEKY